jgi:hypothetical protein
MFLLGNTVTAPAPCKDWVKVHSFNGERKQVKCVPERLATWVPLHLLVQLPYHACSQRFPSLGADLVLPTPSQGLHQGIHLSMRTFWTSAGKRGCAEQEGQRSILHMEEQTNPLVVFALFLILFYYYYSYVHTRLGSFLAPAPTPSLTTHSAHSLSSPPPQYPAETILPLFLILL